MAEIPIELGGVEKFVADTKRASDETRKLTGTLKGAIAGEVITSSLARISAGFDGITKSAITAAAQIAQGFFVGGPLGAGLALVGAAISFVTSDMAKMEAQARSSAEAYEAHKERMLAADKKHRAALREVNEEMAVSNREIAAALKAHKGEGDFAEVLAGLDRQALLDKYAEQLTIIRTAQLAAEAERKGGAERNTRRLFQAEHDEREGYKKLEIIGATYRAALLEAESDTAQARTAAAKKAAAERAAVGQRHGDEMVAQFLKEEGARLDEIYRTGAIERAAADLRLADIDAELEAEADAGFRARQRKEADEREADERAKRRHEFAFEDRARLAGWAAARLVQIEKNASDEKVLVWEDEKQQREAINAAWVNAGLDTARSVVDLLVAGEGEVTKAALESKAKQAGIEALFQVAQGIAATAAFASSFGLAAPLAGAAAAHFAAAAKFAAIGAIAGVASVGASSGGGVPATSATGGFAVASARGRERDDSRVYGGDVRSGGNTYVFQGGVLLSQADAAKAVRKANAESERTR